MAHLSAGKGLDYGCECMFSGQAPERGMRQGGPDSKKASLITQTGQYRLLRNVGPATSAILHVTTSRIQTLP